MIHAFNDLDESDIRQLLEDDERQPLMSHRRERDPRSISKGWLTWLAGKLGLATKGELMTVQDDIHSVRVEFESYRDDVTAAVSAANEKISALEAQIVAMPPNIDTTELQTTLQEIKAAHAAIPTKPAS